MEGSLLHTRLHIPRATAALLSRPRLTRRLGEQTGGCLTLVSAPAGYGKTTLVGDYLRQQGDPAAWLTLDPQDNDPVLFWRYVIAALQRVDPRLGLRASATLSVISKTSPETAVTLLINDLVACINAGETITLVLDDFHWIHTAAIFQSLNFLLQRQPRQLRLLLLTRSDPPLSLARLRVEGRLLELRAGDLRLTPAEIGVFFNEVMALPLSDDALALLARGTEGWAAGLQLVALSLRQSGAPDTARVLDSLSGANKHVFAYLVEEVLRQQPPEIRHFLQHTAVLRQFSAPLCTAVTGQDHAEQLLREITAQNLFITPLDDQGHWYRYHPLFAETLRTHLDVETQRGCHRRAAHWYAGQQLIQDALRNALAAEDYELTAALLTQTYKMFLARGLLVSLQHWLAALPAPYQTPRLRLAAGWCRVYVGNELELQQIVNAIEEQMAEPDEPFRGEMLAVQAVYASLYGELDRSIRLAGEALSLIPPDDYLSRAAAYHALGNAYRYQGELDAALSAYGQARQQFEALGNVFMGQLPLYRSAHVQIMQGRLHQALRTYESVRQLAQEAGHEPAVLSGEIYGYLSELYCEWNELDRAVSFAHKEIELAQSGSILLALVDGYLKLVTALAAQGEIAAAREAMIRAAEAAAHLYSEPVTAQVALHQARYDLDSDNLPAAIAWADAHTAQRKTKTSSLTPLLAQTADLLLARIRLAQGHARAALALLEEALRQAEAAGRTRLVVEANILQALALQAQKQEAAGRKALIRALAMARAEDYVRVFVENGPALAPLLQQVRHLFPTYTRRLLDALPVNDRPAEGDGEPALYEPLTARELEILTLIARGFSNRDIAETLVLSVGTVKGHISHTFGKLNVRNRTQALVRARELNLLDS
jgi:LuxR family maltose regulon positive regulatory protein